MSQRTKFLNQLDYLANKFKEWETVGDATPGPTVRELIDQGYLSDYNPNMYHGAQHDVQIKKGKYQVGSTVCPTKSYGLYCQQLGRGLRASRLNKMLKLQSKGWEFAKYITINGGRKALMVKKIRAARKVNGKVEFYDKSFIILINSAGQVVYSSN